MAELTGMGGGSTSIVTGKVSIGKLKHKGDILVTQMTDPAMLDDMLRAGAVVTDQGGRMCHAALVCNEQGIPFVVGTMWATRDLKDGMTVTVNPVDGTVVSLV